MCCHTKKELLIYAFFSCSSWRVPSSNGFNAASTSLVAMFMLKNDAIVRERLVLMHKVAEHVPGLDADLQHVVG